MTTPLPCTKKQPLPCPSEEGILTSTLPRLLSNWLLDGQVRGFSPSTLSIRRILVEQLIAFLQEKEHETCGRAEVSAFLLWLQVDRRIKPATLFTYYTRLKTFFTFLTREEMIASSPMLKIPKPVYRENQIQPFTQADINAILHVCSQSAEPERNKAIVTMLYDTGIRASELCGIKRGDVDLAQQQLVVLGKGNKKRTVPFGKSCLQALVKYLRTVEPEHEQDEVLFFSWSETESRQGLTRSGLQQLIERLGHAAKIQGVRCSPHTLRHTFAVSYLRNGGDPFTLQVILGHEDLRMTRKYVAIAQTDVASQHKKFSPADNLKRR